MSTVNTPRLSLRTLTLVGFENALVMLALAGASYVCIGWGGDGWSGSMGGFAKILLVAVVCQLCLYYADLYDLRVVSDRRELAVRALQAFGASSLLLAVLYQLWPQLIIGRGVFIIASAFVITSIFGLRIVFEWTSLHVRARERLLLMGTGQAAVRLARELYERRAELGVEIVGFVDENPALVGRSLINPGVIGVISDVPRIVSEKRVDRVVVSLADVRGTLPMQQLLDMRFNKGTRFDYLASVYEEYTGKIAVENLRPSWFVFASGFHKSRILLVAKRAFDITVSALALLLILPVAFLIALTIRTTSPGPAFYHQRRVGRHGRVFTVHKFRSMRVDAEASTGAVWAQPGKDVRVTTFGRFLRRTRLDELPQLWNVLTGDMSIVGPRPERPEFVKELTVDIPFYGQRHVVKPGITGWAQVRYSYGATREDAMEKLQYDLFYIKNLSIVLDLYIIFETVRTVIMRRGS